MITESFPLPTWLIDCTVHGSIAILLVIAMVPLVRRILGAQAAYLLWAIVILRLLVPWLPATPLHWEAPSLPPAASPTSALVSGTQVSVTVKTGEAGTPSVSPLEATGERPAAEPDRMKTTSRPWSWGAVAVPVWLGGMITVLGWSIFRGIRSGRLVRRARDVSDDPVFSGIPDTPVSRVRIKESGELQGPALTGVLRPVILLPLDWRHIPESQLKCVLTHELGHFHRGDLLWRWAFLVARSVHWFNPLVWLAERFARTDQEMACDEWALLRNSGPDHVVYGEALIASSYRLRRHTFAFPIQAGMAESHAGLKRRIRHLVAIRSHGWRAVVISLSLSSILVVLTGPARSEDAADPTESSSAISKPKPPAKPIDEIQKASIPQAPQKRSESSPKTKATQFQIESKFMELTAEMVPDLLTAVDSNSLDATLTIQSVYKNEKFQALLRRLDQKKGVDLMSAPIVTTKSGNKAVINVIREFKYPEGFEQAADGKTPPTPSSFKTRNLGVTLTVEPTLTPSGSIKVILEPEVVDFKGFVDFGGSRAAKENLDQDALKDIYEPSALGVINQPIFGVRRARTVATLRDRETIVLGGLSRDDVQKVEDTDPSTGKVTSYERPIRRALFVFVTVTSIGPDGRPINSTQASAHKPAAPRSMSPPPIKDKDIFYGIAVPRKPGFAMSPYAPGSGYVDLRGFPANTEVKDPYTGQIFLVPALDGAAATPESLPDPATPLGKAARIMIPSVEFKDADLSDVLETLKNKGMELDSASEPAKRGLNLVLKLPAENKAARKITAKLKDISLLEALRFAAATNDLVVVGETDALSIQPKEVGPLISRTYQVPKALLSALQATKPSNLKSFWRAHGVDFPPGASVAFRAPDQVMLRLSKEEHEKLQKLFTSSVAPTL